MKKCSSCGKENYKDKYWCEKCGDFLGYADKYIDKKEPKQKKKKEPERVYVPGYHYGTGRWMKKSTYEWMKKKEKKESNTVKGWLLIILIVTLIIKYPSWTILWIAILLFIISRE